MQQMGGYSEKTLGKTTLGIPNSVISIAAIIVVLSVGYVVYKKINK